MNDEECFQVAVNSAGRIVKRCRAHVNSTVRSLQHYTDVAAPSTLYATDRAAAAEGHHRIAFDQTVTQVEALSNALVGYLAGLDLLMRNDTFLSLPATLMTRAIVEVCAACAWALDADSTAGQRAARGYATLFRALENGRSHAMPDDATNFDARRDDLIRLLEGAGIRVTRRVKNGRQLLDVAQVSVGSTQVKTNFNISQRINQAIPSISGAYSGLSSAAHGEWAHVTTAWGSPDSYARRIGWVVHESVAAWSSAMHTWVGVEPALVRNERDLRNLKESIHPDTVASFTVNKK